MSNINPNICYCPSRWLLAHHDPKADISTQSSHVCLADLNNNGENILALIDFKSNENRSHTTNNSQISSDRNVNHNPSIKSPFECRLKVYQGQQLIYNHLLEDTPSCLLATSSQSSKTDLSSNNQQNQKQTSSFLATLESYSSTSSSFLNSNTLIQDKNQAIQRALLSFAINDHVYFYQKLKPSHKLSLKDDECLLDSFNKSEYDAWQMVRQNKVDLETMYELLNGIANEFGVEELSSHSNNFLSLENEEERKNYLLFWKFKRFDNCSIEQLMSMDTICCAAARLKFSSNITLSGDFGQTRETGTFLLNSNWYKILDIQRDGLVLGTEDRHLLIYELRTSYAHLECHYKLPGTPDNILVERRSPNSFNQKSNLRELSYKILVSCRNCCIYSINQKYLCDKKMLDSATQNKPKELIKLRCNVLQMSWSGDEAKIIDGISYQNFVVACLDKKIYCFSSLAGQCQWVIEVELPITCIVSLPMPSSSGGSGSSDMANNDKNLIGVASQAERIDFYVSSCGRIVDTIYLNNDYCQSMTFGRFGREDNCLCLTTRLGHLTIFILKRTAKFAHGQCLSSAASYARQALARSNAISMDFLLKEEKTQAVVDKAKILEPPSVPSGFKLIKSLNTDQTEEALKLLQADHNCEQVTLAKSTLDERMLPTPLQIPTKSRAFVDYIVEQSRQSKDTEEEEEEFFCSLMEATGPPS